MDVVVLCVDAVVLCVGVVVLCVGVVVLYVDVVVMCRTPFSKSNRPPTLRNDSGVVVK